MVRLVMTHICSYNVHCRLVHSLDWGNKCICTGRDGRGVLA